MFDEKPLDVQPLGVQPLGERAEVFHSFDQQNTWSQSDAVNQWWDAIYRRQFPTLSGIVRNKTLGAAQTLGIDTVIVLPNGKTIAIEEKMRRKMGNDILLEHTRNDKLGKPGWIEQDLAVDFLAYGFWENNLAYFLSWPLLKQAWMQNGTIWKSRFGVVTARNKNYNTLCTPVPVRTLYFAINEVSVVPCIMD